MPSSLAMPFCMMGAPLMGEKMVRSRPSPWALMRGDLKQLYRGTIINHTNGKIKISTFLGPATDASIDGSDRKLNPILFRHHRFRHV